jgi:hypothetical protein
VVFLNEPRPFTLRLDGLQTPLRAGWYQPLTGRRADAGQRVTGEAKLEPPKDWDEGPIVLHVASAPRP